MTDEELAELLADMRKARDALDEGVRLMEAVAERRRRERGHAAPVVPLPKRPRLYPPDGGDDE